MGNFSQQQPIHELIRGSLSAISNRFLLIAQPGSYRIAPYIRAAKAMGLEILIASRGEFSLITEIHEGLHIDVDDPDAALQIILAAAADKPFVGVLGCDDTTVELAAMVAEQLGLPHNPVEAARLSHRKDLARAHLLQAGCPVPMHCLIDLSLPPGKQLAGLAPELTWPCVLKPLNLAASRGVMRVNNEAEFIQACQRIRPIIAHASDPFERQHILIEEYIEGSEIAFEGYLQDGELHALALFDKPDPLSGPFFEETIYVTPSELNGLQQNKIHQRVAEACVAYGLSNGPVHAELRFNEEDAWILEVATRTIGGDCARMLDNYGNESIEALTIALACGKTIEPAPAQGARGVMMIPIPKAGILRRVEGLPAARKIKHIDKIEIVIPDGHELIPLPEGNQYPGYIFASADDPAAVVAALRKAHEQLRLVIAPLWKIGTASKDRQL